MPEKKPPFIRIFLIQTFWLSLTVLLTWIWNNRPFFANLNLLFVLVLTFLYLTVKIILGRKKPFANLLLNTLIFISALLTIISSTGGLGSSFFFLTYFLLFAAALIFDPATTLTLSLALALYFANNLTSSHAALQLLSLLLFTPLAIFFGRQYLKLLASQKKIKILVKEGRKLEKAVENEETETLLWLSLNLKDGLLKIIEKTSDLLTDIGRLNLMQKEKLQTVHQIAKELLKSGQKLQEKIDQETD